MLPMNRSTRLVGALFASLALAGCAADAIRTSSVTRSYRHARTEQTVARKEQAAPVETGSIAKDAVPVTSKDDPRWQWCEQRHLDHQAGKAPGGATDLAKKLADDRLCATVYERTAASPASAAPSGAAAAVSP
jgi:hypothetical protein